MYPLEEVHLTVPLPFLHERGNVKKNIYIFLASLQLISSCLLTNLRYAYSTCIAANKKFVLEKISGHLYTVYIIFFF